MRTHRFHSAGVLALCAGMILGIGVVGSTQAAAVFVNELHYDNAGTDTQETIEIAGPAGTDLSGWSLALYNGANGQLYDSVALAGVIPDQQNGVGTVSFSFPTNGIQNGSPDGIALVRPDNSVVQFLSYEGSFAAVDGPAAGQNSTDIGVQESSSTPSGYSLQLVGSGRSSEDFSWSGPLPSTFDLLNNPDTTPTDLFFSEYVEGSSNNKALEIFNGTGEAIDLGNYEVRIYFNGSTSAGTTIALTPTGVLAPGEVWVLADNDANPAILAVTDQTSTSNFFNGNDAVALFNLVTMLNVDVIGQIGLDPGSEWSSGGVGTQNETMRRNSTVFTGDTVGTDAFFPGDEWSSFAQDTFDGLGAHTIDTALLRQTILPADQTVPEPATLALFGMGLAGLAALRRRNREPRRLERPVQLPAE